MERERIPDREAAISIVEDGDSDVFSMAEDIWADRGFECTETVVSSIDLLGDPVVVVRYILESEGDKIGEYVVILEDEAVSRRMFEVSHPEDIELFIIDEDGLSRVM